MFAQTQTKMSLSDVMKHELFARLSEKQQLFVVRLISRDGQDPLDATKVVYEVQPNSAMSMKCQIMRSPKVQRVLKLWRGEDSVQKFAIGEVFQRGKDKFLVVAKKIKVSQ